MLFEVFHCVVVVLFDRMGLDGSVEDFHLSVGPGVTELRELVPDPMLGAGLIEEMDFVFGS